MRGCSFWVTKGIVPVTVPLRAGAAATVTRRALCGEHSFRRPCHNRSCFRLISFSEGTRACLARLVHFFISGHSFFPQWLFHIFLSLLKSCKTLPPPYSLLNNNLYSAEIIKVIRWNCLQCCPVMNIHPLLSLLLQLKTRSYLPNARQSTCVL